jgi:hypothetical protein
MIENEELCPKTTTNRITSIKKEFSITNSYKQIIIKENKLFKSNIPSFVY